MLALDGSTLEGGGQLVRVALSLSAICAVPVHIYNIRAGRGAHSFQKRARDGRRNQGGRASSQGPSNPRGRGAVNPATAKQKPGGGLKESHLAALTWLAGECRADVEGAEMGSQDLIFKPARRKDGHGTATRSSTEGDTPEDAAGEVIELKNPGSVWLIWQAIFPYIVFSLLHRHRHRHRHHEGGSETSAFRISLKGGTNVPKSPSSEYVQQVLLPLCERIGLPKVEIRVLKRGWTTGVAEIGEVEITVFHPTQPWRDDEGKSREVDAVIGKQKGRAKADGVDDGAGFILDPFQLISPEPTPTVTSISMTIIAGSPKTHTLVESQLFESLRTMPAFASSSLPIQLHPSSSADSGDERRLYVLLVAHTSAGYPLGSDYLSPGRKVANESDRQRTVDEAVGTVVRAFARECARGSCVDEFAEDQLIIFQALADGASSVDGRKSGKNRGTTGREDTGSLHTRTVRWVCREMLGTVFNGQGRCEGGGMRREERGPDDIEDELEALSITEDYDKKD